MATGLRNSAFVPAGRTPPSTPGGMPDTTLAGGLEHLALIEQQYFGGAQSAIVHHHFIDQTGKVLAWTHDVSADIESVRITAVGDRRIGALRDLHPIDVEIQVGAVGDTGDVMPLVCAIGIEVMKLFRFVQTSQLQLARYRETNLGDILLSE